MSDQTNKIRCVQPGESGVFVLERFWGRLRRRYLRWLRRGYVARMAGLRRGDCPDCPHDIVDARDLKLYRNVCGFWFPPEADAFAWRDRLPFARMGLAEVVVLGGGGFLVALGLLFIAPLLAILPAAFGVFICWFFRDPRREIPTDPQLLLSPCDGRVDDIVEVECCVLGVPAIRIGVSLSLFNVHVNRTPIRGRVFEVRYSSGIFKNAMRRGDHSQNEQLWTVFEPAAPGTPRVAVRQIAGPVARRIVCEVRPGQEVAQGEPFGMIKFGSRTELYLPRGAGFTLLVQAGDRVKGGLSRLARVPCGDGSGVDRGEAVDGQIHGLAQPVLGAGPR